MPYDADNIIVLSKEEIEAKFPWHMVNKLATTYHKHPDAIKRAVEASIATNTPIDYYERRYLQHKDIPEILEFTEAYKSITRSDTRGFSSC